jgi:D-tyrosyl-tRNA(Tyr) deacylase
VPREAGAQGQGKRPLQARALAAAEQQAVRGARDGPRLKAVVQRVARACVTPGGEVGPGLCILLGVARGDTAADAERLAGKVARLRIFQNDGKFDLSLLDVGGAALVVSQFTLIADTAKGNRPSFSDAAPPEEAEPVYEAFCAALREVGVEVATGVFGARMQVEIVNDGPVTIVLGDR